MPKSSNRKTLQKPIELQLDLAAIALAAPWSIDDFKLASLRAAVAGNPKGSARDIVRDAKRRFTDFAAFLIGSAS